jgi:hypothetical protein
MRIAISVVLATLALSAQDAKFGGPSDANPAVTKLDIRVVRRARQILNSPAKWNRADNRECPASQTTYSLYCALEKATRDVSKQFEHRGAAMQQARFVIDEVLAKGNHYNHRLMDYNNDTQTTFAGVQKFFTLLEERIQKQLARQPH